MRFLDKNTHGDDKNIISSEFLANSFPKNKTNATANDWNSSIVSDQVEYSLDYETGLLKTSIQPSNTNLPASTVRVSSNKNDNTNGNKAGRLNKY